MDVAGLFNRETCLSIFLCDIIMCVLFNLGWWVLEAIGGTYII